MLYCDIYCVDYDGNLVDAGLLALAAALCNTKIPDVAPAAGGGGGQLVLTGAPPRQLGSARLPLPLSFTVLEGKLLADPALDEERLGAFADTDSGMIGGGDAASSVESGGTANTFTVVIDEAGNFVSPFPFPLLHPSFLPLAWDRSYD